MSQSQPTAKNDRLDAMSPIARKNGGTYWLRVGTAFRNRDGSVTVYLDAFPANGKLCLREPRERNEEAAPEPEAG